MTSVYLKGLTAAWERVLREGPLKDYDLVWSYVEAHKHCYSVLVRRPP